MSTRTRSVLSVAAITGAIGLAAIGAHEVLAQNEPGNAQQPAMQMNTNGTNGGGFNNTAYNGSPVVTETAPIVGGTGFGYAYTPGWGAHLTQALIDLRQARGYLNFPNKFDMMDDDWSAVHHVSDAIKDAEANNIYDGHAVYFTPAESVTLSDTDRLWKAKDMVKKAQDEIGQVDTSGNSNLGNLSADLSAASDSLDKAMAADDWRQSLTNDTQFLPTGSRDY